MHRLKELSEGPKHRGSLAQRENFEPVDCGHIFLNFIPKNLDLRTQPFQFPLVVRPVHD